MGEFDKNDPEQISNPDSEPVTSAGNNGLDSISLLGGDSLSRPSRSIEDISRELVAGLTLSDIYGSGAGSDLDRTDRPVLGNDAFYGIDSLTGKVTEYPSVRTDLWTKADQDHAKAISDRGYSYGLDPVTGRLTTYPNNRTDVYAKADADRDRIIRDRGWSYGLDPATGRVVRVRSGPVLE